MSASYSGTPLIKKLGINPTDKLKLINAPEEYMQWLGKMVASNFARKEKRQISFSFLLKTRQYLKRK